MTRVKAMIIKILVADDRALVRAGLKHIVATTNDIVVTAEASQGSEILERLSDCAVDLLLMEMLMQDIPSIELIRQIRAENPELPVLVLTVCDEAHMASRAIRAGASGYLTKNNEPPALLAAIRKLVSGGCIVDPKLVDAMVFSPHRGDLPPHDVLSDREYQILQMLATGRKINEIAGTCEVSAKTISSHKLRLMRKLGLENNAEIIRYAVRHGLVTSETAT